MPGKKKTVFDLLDDNTKEVPVIKKTVAKQVKPKATQNSDQVLTKELDLSKLKNQKKKATGTAKQVYLSAKAMGIIEKVRKETGTSFSGAIVLMVESFQK